MNWLYVGESGEVVDVNLGWRIETIFRVNKLDISFNRMFRDIFRELLVWCILIEN